MAGNTKSQITRMPHQTFINSFEPTVEVYVKQNPIEGPLPKVVKGPPELGDIFYGFKTVQNAAQSNENLAVLQRNAMRGVVNTHFINFVDFVLLAAREDDALPVKLKLDFLLKPAGTKASLKLQMERLVLKGFAVSPHPTLEGTVLYKAEGAVRRALEIQYTYSDPTVEANWAHFKTSGGSKGSGSGLESGRRCNFRGRQVGKDEHGAWSRPVSVMIP
ncbi:hypothetical protein L4X63_03665 [Geomonas sp. Red32]|uniref:hypothetical protein n=1 Tax=Geomonas sp. Red32 TaxID=2912856 RepID=UPI00202CDDC5|nr:hypothetical protein [Geomonas sp. Red32]MCM0080683.1 hypothetical protein [Geomonas sp. Red32]